jgi:ABC-type branched-subunit amino acid transport system substrate-binding protein
MSRTFARLLAAFLALALIAVGCSDDKKAATGNGSNASASGGGTAKIDYTAIGLWDDGPCDTAKPKLVIGLMTVFESPVISLKDQATALEASATAFNQRGGANGSCIDVHTCDDKATTDQAVACAKEIDGKGVVATVNDQGTAGQADVNAALVAANIPRIATNVGPDDWASPISYPLDASGTGVTLLQPQALIDQGAKKIGIVRVDLAAASAIVGLLNDLYKAQGASFPFDAPIPGGTTDFSQFILGAQNANVDALTLSAGEQEALQVVKAGQQLDTKLILGASLGTFSHKSVADLGDFAKQMVFLWSYPPATADLPVYKALRADLAASGDASLQPENLKASPMRSWIGLYALLKMIRDAKMTDFTRAGITTMLQQAKDVPMLGLFGTENWTPNLDRPGLIKRAGVNHWAAYTWDPNANSNGFKGNFVEKSTFSFDKVTCGSIFGAPAGSC